MMKKALWRFAILLTGVVLVFFGEVPDPAGAASCWANVICSFPGGSTYNNTESWGNGSWPFSGREWSACRDNCNGYVAGLDLQGMAKERNVCGTVECNATYWLGARPARSDCGPRRIQVACPVGPDPGQKTDFQYAAKFVCGPATTNPLVEDGNYQTTINIHNPQYVPVNFRYKAALAGFAQDGRISDFVLATIGADGAQAFDCGIIRGLFTAPPTGLIDGFLVLESTVPLDVVGYYTATKAAQNVTAIHIEKYDARAVPAHDPLCRKDVTIPLADVNNWQTSSANLAVTVDQPLPPSWDSTRTWMSYQLDGIPGGVDFIYQLDFCSCSSGTVRVVGNVKSDNAARGDLYTITAANSPQQTQIFDTGTPSFPAGDGNFKPTDSAVALSGTPVNVGSGLGNIVITVHNGMAYTGVSITGSLILTEGHVGPCQQ